jgi:hypothetical protein
MARATNGGGKTKCNPKRAAKHRAAEAKRVKANPAKHRAQVKANYAKNKKAIGAKKKLHAAALKSAGKKPAKGKIGRPRKC